MKKRIFMALMLGAFLVPVASVQAMEQENVFNKLVCLVGNAVLGCMGFSSKADNGVECSKELDYLNKVESLKDQIQKLDSEILDLKQEEESYAWVELLEAEINKQDK